jgi:protease IV
METPNNPSSQDPNNQPSGYPRYDDRYFDEKYGRRRKSRWWIPFVVFLIIIFGFIALIVGAIVSLTGAMEKKSATVRNHSVLHLKVSGAIAERAEDDFFSFLDDRDSPPALYDILTGIRRAKVDENIEGIYIEGGLRAGGAKSAEIRAALEDFKQSGKFIYAFIEFGSERDYYLASVADSVFMPNEGLLEMNGFSIISPFFKGTLEKIGVDYHIEQFEEYKSFAEQYSRTSFSEPAKQELRELLDGRMTDFVRVVSSARNMNPEAVQAVLRRGVYTSDSLMALGFVDGIRSKTVMKEALLAKVNGEKGAKNKSSAVQQDSSTKGALAQKSTQDKVRDKIRETVKSTSQASNDTDSEADEENSDEDNTSDEKSDGKRVKSLRMVNIARYINSESFNNASDGRPVEKDKQIAIVFASGTIVSSGDEGGQIVASAFVRDLKKARENKKVKAIILRIDSPGGSAFASDEMWEEIRKTAKVKPIYASMSDVAASGGYYMAMGCDTIIAHPNTITGSIGVILMLPNASGLIDKIGVTIDTVATSSSAIGYDPALPLASADKERIHRESEKIYRRFVGRVAESRKRSFEDIRSVAKGRVWIGSAAQSRGLVDSLGGIYTAIAMAKRRIGIPEGTKVEIRRYPSGESNRFERLAKRFLSDDDEESESRLNIFARLQKRVDAQMLEKNALWRALPESVRLHVAYMLELGAIAGTERTMMALPNVPEIR